MEINHLTPDFGLYALDGSFHRLSDYRGRIVLVNFWSAECPHVERVDMSLRVAMARWTDGVVWLSVASNAGETLAALENASRSRGLPTVLIDAQQEVADVFAAQVTPEAFVIDRQGVLRYRGAVDDVGFRHKQLTRSFVENAVDALLAGELPAIAEVPAFGCAIIRES